MTKTMPDDLERLTAFIDGELDAAASLQMQRRIEAEPDLAGAYRSLLATSEIIGGLRLAQTASPALRRRVEALGGKGFSIGFALPNWVGLMAAASLAAILSAGTTYSLVKPDHGGDVLQSVIAAHLRGLLAQRPIDVASSDRHTVKPWFNERLAFAPIVPEETAPGFTLVGGRLDMIAAEPAGTVVYQFRSHLISITETKDPDRASTPRQSFVREGLTVMRWRRAGLAFVLVTDLPAAELTQFLAAWP